MTSQSSPTIEGFVQQRNDNRKLFTAGPGSLLAANLTGLRPCFGRDDPAYQNAESDVLSKLALISGHCNVVRMQGAASLALEILIRNFLYGRILIVQTGYYSMRLSSMVNSAAIWPGSIVEIDQCSWLEMENLSGRYDWVLGCSVETSIGLKLPVEGLRLLADRLNARLALDATASIGLEVGHELADVIAYSSCKGLFGLTGAAFIASHDLPTVEVDSFYLSYASHRDKRMTGPLHTILSLADVLPKHLEYREAVAVNKEKFISRMQPWLVFPAHLQPLLCTRLSREIRCTDTSAVLYTTRFPVEGSVICHLGEIHLGSNANGAILDCLELA